MIDVAAALAIVTMLSSGPAPARGVPVQEKTHPSVAGAADPSQADTIRRRLKKDQKVRVTDDQGREWQGRIDAFDADKLVLLTKDPRVVLAPSLGRGVSGLRLSVRW